jgi:hypothetical protein
MKTKCGKSKMLMFRPEMKLIAFKNITSIEKESILFSLNYSKPNHIYELELL